jgi:hypothetical protein
MTTTELDATVFRDGRTICTDAGIVLQYQPRHVPVPIAGDNRYMTRDVGHHLPTIIRFLDGVDPDFEAELAELAHGATDNDVRRSHRDHGWAPAPIDLELDDGRPLNGCRVQYPVMGFGAVHTIDFQLAHTPL